MCPFNRVYKNAARVLLGRWPRWRPSVSPFLFLGKGPKYRQPLPILARAKLERCSRAEHFVDPCNQISTAHNGYLDGSTERSELGTCPHTVQAPRSRSQPEKEQEHRFTAFIIVLFMATKLGESGNARRSEREVQRLTAADRSNQKSAADNNTEQSSSSNNVHVHETSLRSSSALACIGTGRQSSAAA